jgi:type IV secretory pathway VirB4 component
MEELDRTGYARAGGETIRHWLERLRSAQSLDDRLAGLEDLLAIHNQYRFDPRGINSRQRKMLEAGVRKWLSAN